MLRLQSSSVRTQVRKSLDQQIESLWEAIRTHGLSLAEKGPIQDRLAECVRFRDQLSAAW